MAIAKVRQRQAEIARLKLAYETARAGGKLVAARAAVEAWSRMVDPQSPEIQAAWAELSPLLRRAEALAARARKLERTDPPAARDFYRQALDIAADLPDALAGLDRTPPDPPTAMDAQVLGDRIRLIWTPPPPDGLGPLTFVVVRKRNGVLQHPADGTRIAEVGTCEFDDTHVTPGETVGYAVLSSAAGSSRSRRSRSARSSSSPTSRTCRVDARDHEVELTWSPPRASPRSAWSASAAPRRPNPATATGSRGAWTTRSTATSTRIRTTITGSMPSTGCPTAGCIPRRGSSSSARDGRADRGPARPAGRGHRRAPGAADPSELRRPAPAAGSAPVGARRRPGHAPLAMDAGGLGRADRRPTGGASPGTKRPARDHGERPSHGLRPTATAGRSAYRRDAPGHPPDRRPPGRGRANGAAAEPSLPDGGPWHIRVYSVAEWDGVRSLSPGLEPSAATILPGPHAEVTVRYHLKRPLLPGSPGR